MFDPREVLVKSLESLTPGGSEFSNDPERCIAWIEDRLATVTEQVKKRQQAEAENAKLRAVAEAANEFFNSECYDLICYEKDLCKHENNQQCPAQILTIALAAAGYGGDD